MRNSFLPADSPQQAQALTANADNSGSNVTKMSASHRGTFPVWWRGWGGLMSRSPSCLLWVTLLFPALLHSFLLISPIATKCISTLAGPTIFSFSFLYFFSLQQLACHTPILTLRTNGRKLDRNNCIQRFPLDCEAIIQRCWFLEDLLSPARPTNHPDALSWRFVTSEYISLMSSMVGLLMEL